MGSGCLGYGNEIQKSVSNPYEYEYDEDFLYEEGQEVQEGMILSCFRKLGGDKLYAIQTRSDVIIRAEKEL